MQHPHSDLAAEQARVEFFRKRSYNADDRANRCLSLIIVTMLASPFVGIGLQTLLYKCLSYNVADIVSLYVS